MNKAAKKNGWTHTVTCPDSECEADIDVAFYPGRPAQTYGPPERCYPEDPADLDSPDKCVECGRAITEEDVERWIVEIEERESQNVCDENPWKGDKRDDLD